jgi:hypothetical protein
MQYTPFRKNFYVEVPEIARMTSEEVEAYKEVQQTVAIITHAYLVGFIGSHFLPHVLNWKPGSLGVRRRFMFPRSFGCCWLDPLFIFQIPFPCIICGQNKSFKCEEHLAFTVVQN